MYRNRSGDRKTYRNIGNQGVSLIELLVVIAIIAIVGGLIAGFIMTSTKAYKSADKEVNLQYEAQLAVNQIRDCIIDANANISQSEDTYSIYNRTEEGYTRETLSWDASKQAIFYEKWKKDKTDSQEVVQTEAVKLADYVDDFSMDLSKAEEERKVEIALSMSYKGKEYSTSSIVNLRNAILVNDTKKEYDTPVEEEVSTVTEVRVTTSKYTILPGNEQPFIAEVEGNYYPSKAVVWSVEVLDGSGPVNGTKLEATADNLAILTVALGETANKLRITATSVQNPNVSGYVDIEIHHNALTITPEEVWLGVTSNHRDPDGNSTITSTFTAELASGTLDGNAVYWYSPEESGITGNGSKKTVRIGASDTGKLFHILAQTTDPDTGTIIVSNEAVVHAVAINAVDKNDNQVTMLADGEKATLVIMGMETVPEGNLKVAKNISEIKNGSSDEFYLYDTRNILKFSNVRKNYDGTWECDVSFVADSNFWEWLWNPVFMNARSTSIGVYQGGRTNAITDDNGNKFDYGFTIYKMSIEYSWW